MRTVLTALALTIASSAGATLPADFIVNTTVDSTDAAPGDGVCADAFAQCSLRAAVQEASALGGGAIALAPGATYVLSLGLAGEDAGLGGDLDITGAVRILGEGATIDGNGIDRIFDVPAGAALWAEDLTLVGGFVSAASGGAVRSAGDLRLTDVTVMGNVAIGAGASGGGIFNDRGFAHLLRTTLQDNSAERAGGAIEANEGTTIVAWSSMLDNATGAVPGNGGGLHLTGRGTVIVSYATVSGNTATREGGGLWNSSTGTMQIDNSIIDGNSATGIAADDGGGGVFNDGGFLTISTSTITNNTAMMGSGSGGGVFNNNGDLSIWVTTIAGNMASRAGGGIEALIGATAVINSTLSENSTGPTPGNGGALHLTGAGDVLIDTVRVVNNVASSEGGGLWNSVSGTMQIIDSFIGRNVANGALADQGGGGLFNDGGDMIVENTRILENRAPGAAGSGGGVLNNLGYVLLDGCEISRNSSSRAGGGVEANIGETSLISVRLIGNSTGSAPGNGGGLHLTGAGAVDLSACTVNDNTATAEGGGVWNSATGTMTVSGSTFRNNTAPVSPQGHNDGGAMTFNGRVIPTSP